MPLVAQLACSSGERYQKIINNYFWHQLEVLTDKNDDIHMRDLWFQQEGAQKLLKKLPNRSSSLILVIKIGRKKVTSHY